MTQLAAQLAKRV